MRKWKVLLAGESWFFTTIETKGFDQFTIGGYQTEVGRLQAIMEDYAEITHIPAHLVATDFPADPEQLKEFDAVIVSDVGSNTFLLHPDTFFKCETTPDKLAAIARYVEDGGTFGMMGGYMTFQGIDGKANWHGTIIEELLPVEIMDRDDRVECPQGAVVQLDNQASHPMVEDFPREWPPLLGYNRILAKPQAEVVVRIKEDPLLVLGRYGKGRTFAWASDCAPHWMPPAFCDWDYNRVLWQRVLDWAAGKKDETGGKE